MPPWYDTHHDIDQCIQTSLESIHRLVNARCEAGYVRKERMDEWCILGRFSLDSCGNIGLLTEGAPFASGRPYPGVMPFKDVFGFAEHVTVSFQACLPPADGSCDLCGEPWEILKDLGNLLACKLDGWENPPTWRHPHCHQQALIERARAEFTALFMRVEIPILELRVIPNEYYPHPQALPWVKVETYRGEIKLGWRKRVINIDWSNSQLKASPSLFGTESVTKWEGGIHAWSMEDAAKYLSRLWRENL